MKLKLFLVFCLFLSYSIQAQQAPEKKELWLTVFVHGIVNIQPYITPSNILKFYYDKIEDTIYTRAIESVRKDSYFWQCQAMDKIGLHKIDQTVAKPGIISPLLANLYNELSQLTAPTPQENIYYTFGWSGLFSNNVRYLEADILYTRLYEELKKYHARNIYPRIRVVGYSHGGNVTINLAAAHKQRNKPFKVDELLLLGVPITVANKHMILSPFFKKIYHFYSTGDRVQSLDCLTSQALFSRRTFKNSGSFSCPTNMVQIQFRLKRIAFTKANEYPQKFHSNRIRNADPGHTEWWSFGWIYNYRDYLPIYPLPAVTFLTYLTQMVDEQLPNAKHLSADIRPYNETVILHDLKNKTIKKKMPFLTHAHLTRLKKQALWYDPKTISLEGFNTRYDEISKQAKAEKEIEWQKKKRAKKSCRCRKKSRFARIEYCKK